MKAWMFFGRIKGDDETNGLELLTESGQPLDVISPEPHWSGVDYVLGSEPDGARHDNIEDAFARVVEKQMAGDYS